MSDIIDTQGLEEENGFAGEHESDMAATVESQPDAPIEFHVQMRSWTLSDMESLIVEAAARLIVGKSNESDLAKQIERRCIELTAERADRKLAAVAKDILDEPVTPAYGDGKPVTMREFIGLVGREYLSAKVNRSGEPCGRNDYYGQPRIQYLVTKIVNDKFKAELENATRAAVSEAAEAIRKEHAALLAAEKARFREALERASK